MLIFNLNRSQACNLPIVYTAGGEEKVRRKKQQCLAAARGPAWREKNYTAGSGANKQASRSVCHNLLPAWLHKWRGGQSAAAVVRYGTRFPGSGRLLQCQLQLFRQEAKAGLVLELQRHGRLAQQVLHPGDGQDIRVLSCQAILGGSSCLPSRHAHAAGLSTIACAGYVGTAPTLPTPIPSPLSSADRSPPCRPPCAPHQRG